MGSPFQQDRAPAPSLMFTSPCRHFSLLTRTGPQYSTLRPMVEGAGDSWAPRRAIHYLISRQPPGIESPYSFCRRRNRLLVVDSSRHSGSHRVNEEQSWERHSGLFNFMVPTLSIIPYCALHTLTFPLWRHGSYFSAHSQCQASWPPHPTLSLDPPVLYSLWPSSWVSLSSDPNSPSFSTWHRYLLSFCA